MADLSFVRKDIIPERAAPLSETGVIGWFRKNMFSDIPNTILTIIVAIFYNLQYLGNILPWVFSHQHGIQDPLTECRGILGRIR